MKAEIIAPALSGVALNRGEWLVMLTATLIGTDAELRLVANLELRLRIGRPLLVPKPSMRSPASRALVNRLAK